MRVALKKKVIYFPDFPLQLLLYCRNVFSPDFHLGVHAYMHPIHVALRISRDGAGAVLELYMLKHPVDAHQVFTQEDSSTLSIFYKRRPIRDSRQIVDKYKRQGLAFLKNLRDRHRLILEHICIICSTMLKFSL